MMLSRKAGLSYVARGDPGSYDWNEATLTADGAWHTLSLSAIVPANAKLVHLRLRAARSTAGNYFKVRKTGLTNIFGVVTVATQAANYAIEMDCIVPVVSGSIDYWLTSGTWASLGIVVLGWFV